MAGTAQTDAMIARLESELDERNTFVEGLIGNAQDAGRDLSSQEMELIGSARSRISAVNAQLDPLRETSRIAIESRNKAREINDQLQTARKRADSGPVEYRSVGVYVADYYLAGMGDAAAQQRLEVFHRAAAHQTTADNPGLLPQQIVEPVINFVDNARPAVTAIGVTDLGSGSWAYAKVTQHTLVDVQSAEKAELASRKMTVSITPITAPTLGGYVNVSKQNIQRSSPAILDMIIADLASEYAIETEQAACADLLAGATAGTAIDATPTPDEVSAALWAAAATAYSNVRGAGRLLLLVAPGDLALFGRLFAPVNPTNAFSSGFSAGSFGSGAMGAISGIQVIMTPGLTAGQALVVNTAGVSLFEHRYGNMQVNEPSVWGVQVGYAGDFETVIKQTGSVISIDTAP